MQAKVSEHSLMAEGLSAAGGKSYAGEETGIQGSLVHQESVILKILVFRYFHLGYVVRKTTIQYISSWL